MMRIFIQRQGINVLTMCSETAAATKLESSLLESDGNDEVHEFNFPRINIEATTF